MLGVLRRHRGFRRLWTSQVVSQGGSWLNRVAVLTLIGELGGSDAAAGVGALFGVELAVRLVPTAFFGSLAGPIADRLPRRALMLAGDLLQAVIVLGLLLVRDPDDLWLLYVLLLAQMGTAIFSEAARTASVPNTVDKDDLLDANALSAITWSMMLTVGAVAGGVAVRFLGVQGVFLLDAATFLVSASIVLGLRLPPPPRHDAPLRVADLLLMQDMRRGFAHVRERALLPAVFAKTFWGAAGGYLVLLSIAGTERFGGPGEGAAALAIGWLYCARGVGTGLGPILGRWLAGREDRALLYQVSAGFFVAVLGYAPFAVAESLWLAFACVAFAHLGGSAIWVASTTFWQRHVDDAYRGRAYALEYLGMTLSFATGGLIAGAVYDATASIELTTWTTCGLVALNGVLWTLFARPAGGYATPAKQST